MSIYGSPFVVGDECGLQIQCRVEWMNTALASLTSSTGHHYTTLTVRHQTLLLLQEHSQYGLVMVSLCI